MGDLENPGRERLRRLSGDETTTANALEPGRRSAVEPAHEHAGGEASKRALAEARRQLATLRTAHASADHYASTEAAHQLGLVLGVAHGAASEDQRPAVDDEHAWRAAAAPIAAQLGIDATIHVDDAAAAHGARGLAHAGVVHLVPALAPEHADARRILAHELVHVAQSRLSVVGAVADAEREADELAGALVRGSLPHQPRVGIAASRAAADTGAKTAPADAAVSVDEYLDRSHRDLWREVEAYLQSISFPAPAPHTQWRDAAAFIHDTVDRLTQMHVLSSREHLREIVYPADPEAAIKPLLPGNLTWVPTIATAFAQLLQDTIQASLLRLGPRWVEAAEQHPEPEGIADETKSLVAATSIIASHPIDLAVRRGLTGSAVLELDHALALHPKAQASRELRHVKLAWQGDQDATLWNWVRAIEPADATAEEVAASLWTTPRAGWDGPSTFYAYGLVAAPPLFGLPPTWAKAFPEASRFAPDKLDDETPASRYVALASSTSADGLALAQAGHAGAANARSSHTALATLADSRIQLGYLARSLAPWGLANDVIVGLAWVVGKEGSLATASEGERTRWTPVIAAQKAHLSTIVAAVQQIVGLVSGARSTGPDDPFQMLLATYARAAATSAFADTCTALLAAATAQQARLTLATLRASTNDMTRVVDDGAGMTASQQTAAAAVDQRSRALQREMLAGHHVDEEDVQNTMLSAQEIALEQRLAKTQHRVDDLLKEAADVSKDFGQQLVEGFNGKFRDMKAAGWAITTQLTIVRSAWDERAQVRDHIVDPDEYARVARSARREALVTAQAQFAAIGADPDVREFFAHAMDRIRGQAWATRLVGAIAELLAMIALSLVASAAGGMVAEGIAGAFGVGAEAIEAAPALVRALSAGGRIVTETVVNTLGQSALEGKLSWETALSNALQAVVHTGIGTLSKNVKLAERVEEATKDLWRPARAGARLLADGIVITGDIVLNTTLSYVAAKLVEFKTRKGSAAEPLPTDLTDWMMQGASAVLGRYAHGKLHARAAAYKELEKLKTWQPVEKLFATRGHVDRLATEAETQPSHDAALSTLGAIHELFAAEHAAFAAILDDPAKRAAIGMDESSVRGLAGALERGTHDLDEAGLEVLPLVASGLEELVPGEVYTGSQHQIDAAVAAAKQAHFEASQHREPGSDVTTIKIGSKSYEVHDRGAGHDRHDFSHVWPGEIPGHLSADQHAAFAAAKVVYDRVRADPYQSAGAARIHWARELAQHGIHIEGLVFGGTHEIYAPSAGHGAPAKSDAAIAMTDSAGKRMPNAGPLKPATCEAALRELVEQGVFLVHARVENGLLSVPLRDGRTHEIRLVAPRPTAPGHDAALEHVGSRDNVWVSAALVDADVPRALGGIVRESIATADGASASSANYGELDALFVHLAAAERAPAVAPLTGDPKPAEIAAHAVEASKVERAARVSAELDKLLFDMGLLAEGPERARRLTELGQVSSELLARVNERLARHEAIGVRPEAVLDVEHVAKPRAAASEMRKSTVLPDAPAAVRPYSAADYQDVLDARVLVETIAEIDARVALRDQAGTGGRGATGKPHEIALGESLRRSGYVAKLRVILDRLQLGGEDRAYQTARLHELAAVFPGVERDLVPAIEARIARRANAEAGHHEAEVDRGVIRKESERRAGVVANAEFLVTKRLIVGAGMSGLADLATLELPIGSDGFVPMEECVVIGGPDLIERLEPSDRWGQRAPVFDRAAGDAHPAFSNPDGTGNGLLMGVVEDPGEFVAAGELRDGMDRARKHFGFAPIDGYAIYVEWASARRPGTPAWHAPDSPVRALVQVGERQIYVYEPKLDITNGPGETRMPTDAVVSPTVRAEAIASGHLISGDQMLQGAAAAPKIEGKKVLVDAFGPTGAWAAIDAVNRGALRVDWVSSSSGEVGTKESTQAQMDGTLAIDRVQNAVAPDSPVHVTMDRIIEMTRSGDGWLVAFAHGPGEHAEVYEQYYDVVVSAMGASNAAPNTRTGPSTVKNMIGDMKMQPQRGTDAAVLEDETGAVRVMGYPATERINVPNRKQDRPVNEELDRRRDKTTVLNSADSPNDQVFESVGNSIRKSNTTDKGNAP